jgi:putative membrane protein
MDVIMTDFLSDYYQWLVALHLIAVISWMAGMLYLPRLFVYHADAPHGSPQSEIFKVMERRLLRYIMNPAMIVTFGLGILMLVVNPALMSGGWMHMKLMLVFFMAGAHGFLAMSMKKFARDANVRPAGFYRVINEVPTVLMIAIVILAIVKPF